MPWLPNCALASVVSAPVQPERGHARTRPPCSSPYTVKNTVVAVTTMASGSSNAVPSTVGALAHPARGQRRPCPPSAFVVKYTFDPSSAMPRGWFSPDARTVGLAHPERAQATTWPSVVPKPLLVQYTRCESTATAWGRFMPDARTVGPDGQPPIALLLGVVVLVLAGRAQEQ